MQRRDSNPDQPLVGRLWLGGLGLMLLGFIAYLPCLSGPFLWDDRNWSHGIEWLLQDPHGWVRIWTNVRLLEQYFPLTATTVWLDYQCWGWAVFPRHVENVMLHVSAAFFLWRLLRRLEMPGAWLAAALLVVHPVTVESVAWRCFPCCAGAVACMIGKVMPRRDEDGCCWRWFYVCSRCWPRSPRAWCRPRWW
jgi:hypothetical protein